MEDESTLPSWMVHTLIGLVFFMSASLTIFTSFKNRLECSRRTELLALSAIALCCIASGFFGLILYLTNRLSVDAFGVLLIGLLPGLEAFHRIQFALSSLHKFRSKPALHNKLARFAYLRHGNPPRAEVQAEAQVDFPTTTYLHLPHCANATPIKPEIKTRDGAIVLYNERIIVVKNDDDLGDAVRWWRAANSAVNCSRTSSAVEFGEKAQVIRAFELIAELAMIGDMVLLYHSASLKRYVGSSETVRQAVYTTPGRVYSLVVRQLGLLEEWGPMDERQRLRFKTTDMRALTRGEKYGVVFFLLLTESGLFGSARERASGHQTGADVVRAFSECADDGVRSGVTRGWLEQYCTPRDRLFESADVECAGRHGGSAGGTADAGRDAGGRAARWGGGGDRGDRACSVEDCWIDADTTSGVG